MSVNPLAVTIRTKKLGALILDARLVSRRGVAECAEAMGISEALFQEYELGQRAPSLPEIEVLAFFLDIPIDHFWSRTSLSESTTANKLTHVDRLNLLRNRMIGATLRQTRSNANLSPKEITEKIGITETELNAYELGETAVPLPHLEALISALGTHIDFFIDQRGPVGKWMAQQEAFKKFQELPPEAQDFVCEPVNRPYIELARRLSDLNVDKLRAVAEGLLEITY
jgi:transcriptional regulator with XRE-family HTH domain